MSIDTIHSKPVIVRNRVIHSCQRCFRRKKKCDKVKPTCGRCARAKHTCEYFTSSEIRRRSETRRSSARESNNTEDEETPRQNSNLSDLLLTPNGNQTRVKNFKLIENSTGEYSKYVPIGFFPFCDQGTNVSLMVDRLPRANEKILVFDFSTLVQSNLNLNQVKMKMPKKEVSDSLVAHFFESIFPMIPILDKVDFTLKYAMFWNNPQSFNDLNAMILIFAVLFTSCFSMKLNDIFYQGKTRKTVLADYEMIKLHCFEGVENLKFLLHMSVCPSISGLTALTLMYYVASLNCYNLTGEVATLLRYSQMTGLHRKVTNSNEAGLKDLLYSYILLLDAFVCYFNGLPSGVNGQYFETVNNFPKAIPDLNILGSLSKFHCGLLWTEVLNELNKIRGFTTEDQVRINQRYSRTQRLLNAIENEILDFKNTPRAYLEWLTTEGRLGLRHAALLMHSLRIANERGDESLSTAQKSCTIDLLNQCLLLINETTMKVVLGVQAGVECLWFLRNIYPFEAISVILSHVQEYPTQAQNFQDLDENISYTRHPSINYLDSDLRIILVNECCDVLQTIKCLWPSAMQETLKRILDLKTCVFSRLELEQTDQIDIRNDSIIEPNVEIEVGAKNYKDLLNELFTTNDESNNQFFKELDDSW